MAPRSSITKNGIIIAKPGFDITASEANLYFSPKGSMMAVYEQGTIPMGPTVSTGPFSNNYQKSTITFTKTFASPPICIVGIINNTTSAFRPSCQALGDTASFFGVFWGWFEPVIAGYTTTTKLDLFCRLVPSATYNLFAYIILENTT